MKGSFYMDKIYRIYRGVIDGYSNRWKVEEIEIDDVDVFYNKNIAIAESEKRNNEIDMYNKNNCTICKFGKEEKSHYRTSYRFTKSGAVIDNSEWIPLTVVCGNKKSENYSYTTYYSGRDKNDDFKCLDFEGKK
jgi:hypothetical protein